MNKYAPTVLRIGLALVFLWFGTQQLFHTSSWTNLIPDTIIQMSHLNAVIWVHINGSMEIVFGICLLLGFFTQVSSLILALHLAVIALDVGIFTSIGVRDFGLTIATFSIFLNGITNFSLDSYFQKRDAIISK
jgi:uncharacterized membrane protein YphA (DoxX/SURF4 family)